jgi:uncharacterized protein YjiS (DUF1127 family)
MNYVNIPFRPAVRDRLSALIASIREAAAKRASYRQIVDELSALSDRDLDDLGISRHAIADIAWDHVYGN